MFLPSSHIVVGICWLYVWLLTMLYSLILRQINILELEQKCVCDVVSCKTKIENTNPGSDHNVATSPHVQNRIQNEP